MTTDQAEPALPQAVQELIEQALEQAGQLPCDDIPMRDLQECMRVCRACRLVLTLSAALRALELGRAQAPAQADEAAALLEELRINANRLCDRNQGGTYEVDCRRTLRKVDDYQKAAYRAGRGRQRAVTVAAPPSTGDPQ